MRTVTFKSVLWGAARLHGLDPTTPDLDEVQAASITEYINSRIQRAWERAFWPELMTTEERQYRADWAVGTAYLATQEVLGSDDKYYRAVIDNTGNDPTTDDGTNWAVPADFDKYIAYAQAGEAVIDAVQRITKANPRVSQFPGELRFDISDNGFQLGAEAPAKVWVRWRARAPAFDSTPWSTATDYLAGELAYVATTGEVYVAVIATTGNEPSADDGTYWTKVDFPYWLALYTKRSVFADLLVENGQRGESIAQGAIAEQLLQDQELVQFDQQDQPEATRFSAYP